MPAPQLEGEALAAVRHRGSHLQIITSAGSGKTEVVSQRVADLLADGVSARSIVAFTFTERAAEELKNRITRQVEERLGSGALDLLGGLFVGTIHSYCFRLLQQHVPRYDAYDVLDDNQLTAFLSREANRLNIRQLDPAGRDRLFASIEHFLKSVDVVENELLDPATMPDPFGTVLRDYRNLGLHIINYAHGAYEGFDGEPDFALNAVDLTTVHRAKGLEWPVVFVPSLTANRFPTTKAGQRQPWPRPATSPSTSSSYGSTQMQDGAKVSTSEGRMCTT